MSKLLLLLPATLTPACEPHKAGGDPCDDVGENVLVLITDDLGIDKTAVYGEHPTPPPTPHIDALADEGVLFRNAYAQPTCSPSRASLLTGRYPSRHGLGRWLQAEESDAVLPADELTIPQMLSHSDRFCTTAAVGKWHLTGFDADEPERHPLHAGFDFFAGSLANPQESIGPHDGVRGYENWQKDENGTLTWTTDYMTTDTIEDAITLVHTLREPWYLYVATNAAHTPLHNPPESLLDEPMPEDPTELEQHTAMVQVLDDGIGRLLDDMPAEIAERTTVIYTSDNGTATEVDVIEEPWDASRGKQSVYEGGVNVPLLITGPRVETPGTECTALVSQVDLFPTLAEIAGVDLDSLVVETGEAAGQPIAFDGLSLLPYLADPDTDSLRTYVFAEQFFPNGDPTAFDWRNRMVRDADWKLIRNDTHSDAGELSTYYQFFHFEPGAWDEGDDLLTSGTLEAEAQTAYDNLMAELEVMDSALVSGHSTSP